MMNYKAITLVFNWLLGLPWQQMASLWTHLQKFLMKNLTSWQPGYASGGIVIVLERKLEFCRKMAVLDNLDHQS